MRNRFDRLAKAILVKLLRPIAPVETEREIVGQAQRADMWVQSNEAEASELAPLGVLGKMIGLGPCLVEPFSQPPRVRDIRSCIRKQYNLDNDQVLEAERKNRREPAFPVLWVISSGNPATVIEALKLGGMAGWPKGFWQREAFDSLYIVVARQLPKTPETVLLRLLGRGVTLREAIRELATRPEHARAWRVIEPVLVAFRLAIPQDSLEEEDMEALRELEAIYADWEQRLKEEAHQAGEQDGHRAGLRDGLLESIAMLCMTFEIELSDERRAQLAGLEPSQLRELFAALSRTRRWPDEI